MSIEYVLREPKGIPKILVFNAYLYFQLFNKYTVCDRTVYYYKAF